MNDKAYKRMKNIKNIFPLWHTLLVASVFAMGYLITVHLNDAIAIYRASWPPYQRDGFMLLNLRWSRGEITLNSLKTFPGLNKRAGRKIKSSPLYYTIDTKDGVTMKAGYIIVPRELHYDYFDEATGELKGGELLRDDVDFFIRVPNLLKADRMRFYRSNRPKSLSGSYQPMLLERADDSELIGEIDIF